MLSSEWKRENKASGQTDWLTSDEWKQKLEREIFAESFYSLGPVITDPSHVRRRKKQNYSSGFGRGDIL